MLSLYTSMAPGFNRQGHFFVGHVPKGFISFGRTRVSYILNLPPLFRPPFGRGHVTFSFPPFTKDLFFGEEYEYIFCWILQFRECSSRIQRERLINRTYIREKPRAITATRIQMLTYYHRTCQWIIHGEMIIVSMT